jgi:hypothetical protein
MNKLVQEANELLKNGGFDYAFCGGQALDMFLLYKSTDTDREGYQQDFDLAYKAMNDSQKHWLQNALRREYPDGHKWMESLSCKKLELDGIEPIEKNAKIIADPWKRLI